MADLSEHPDQAVVKLWNKITAYQAPLQALYAKFKAASPPSVNELDKELFSSDDPKVIEYREHIKELQAAVVQTREEAQKYLLESYEIMSDEDLAKLRAEFGEHAKRVTSTVGMLKDYAELMEIDGVKEEVEKVQIPSLRGGHGAAGTALGTVPARPQIASVSVVKGDKGKDVDRLSLATQWAGQDTTEVYNAWLAAAGAGKWQDVSRTVTLEFGEYTYTIVPKDKYAGSTDANEGDAEENGE